MESKSRSLSRRSALVLAGSIATLVSAVSAPTASASILYWDPDGLQNGALGGSGTWDLATPNFSTTADDTTGADSVWSDTTGTADVASFGGTAGAVTLNTSLGTLGLVFSTPGYTISGSGTLELGANGLDASGLASGTTTISNALTLVSAQSWTNGTGALLQLNGAINNGGSLLTLNGGGNYNFAAAISGAGGLTMSGSGTATLAVANSYSGGTTINAGTLQLATIGTANGTNSGAFSLGGGNLQINQGANNFAYSPAITLTADSTLSNIGLGAINVSGTLAGNNHALSVNTGPARLFVNGTVTNVSQFNVTAGQMGFDTGAGNQGGGAPVVVSTGATLDFFNGTSTAKTVANNITLNGGTGLGGVGALYREAGGTGTITLSGTVSLNGTSSIGVASSTLALSGLVSGSGGLTKIGANTLTLSNAGSTYSGGTTVSVGTLIAAASSTPTTGIVTSGPLGTGAITLAGGRLSSDGGANRMLANAVSVTGTAGEFTTGGKDFFLNGAVTGTGTFTVGNSFVSATAASVDFGDNLNGFTGTVNYIGNATDNIIFNSVLNTAAKFSLSGSTTNQQIYLNAAGNNTIGELSGAGGKIAAFTPATTLLINQSTSTTYAGVLTQGSAALSVTKANAGTLALTFANLYTGATTVTGGVLSTGATGLLANGGTASSIGKSAVAAGNLVLDGGTLQYANTGAAESTNRLFTIGSTTAGATGTLDASGANPISFTGTGAVAYGTSGQARTLNLTGTNTGANTLSPVIGDNGAAAVAVTKGGTGSWTLAGANTYSGATTVTAGTLSVSGSLSGTLSLVVNGSGALVLAGSGSITSTPTVALGSATNGSAGSTLAFDNTGPAAKSSTFGTLTLSGNSTIDFANGPTSAAFTFSSLSLAIGGVPFSGLTIANYTTGSTYLPTDTADDGRNTDRLLFNADPGLSDAQLAGVSFFNDGGTYLGTGHEVSFGTQFEIVPIPEPSVIGSGLLILGLAGYRERRRLRKPASGVC